MQVLKKSAIVALLIVSTSALQAAGTYRVDFGGTISTVSLSPFAADDSIAVGNSFSGTYIFQMPAVDQDTDPNIGSYQMTGLSSFSVDVGNYTAVTNTNSFAVTNNVGGSDTYSTVPAFGAWIYHDPNGPTLTASYLVDISLTLSDSSGTALSSDAFLTEMPEITAWNVKQFQVTHNANPSIFIQGDLTWMKVTAVPEPASMAAVAIGIAGILRRRKKRA